MSDVTLPSMEESRHLGDVSSRRSPDHRMRNTVMGTAATIALTSSIINHDTVVPLIVDSAHRADASVDRAMEQILGPNDFGKARPEGIVLDSEGKRMGTLLIESALVSYGKDMPIRLRLEPRSNGEEVSLEQLRAQLVQAREGKMEREIQELNLDPTFTHLRGEKIFGESYSAANGQIPTGNGGNLGEWRKFSINGKDYFAAETFVEDNPMVAPVLKLEIGKPNPLELMNSR